jgi:hypothetical protein
MVRVGHLRRRAGGDGTFVFVLDVQEPRRAQARVAVVARQRVRRGGRTHTLRATLRYWTSVQGVIVPGWETDTDEATATPGKTERALAGGYAWAIGRSLYVHYLLAGRLVFAARVAHLRGPCGAADFDFVEFPFAGADGVYRVDFGARPTVDQDRGSWYPRVRLGPAPPPLPPVLTPLFTIVGNGTTATAPDGATGTAAGLPPGTPIAARPDGGILFVNDHRVRLLGASGHVSTVAGTGRLGGSGDGGPAIAAQLAPTVLASLPDGGFLVGQCDDEGDFGVRASVGRIRRVWPDGTITTVAGSGRRGPTGDGAPATATGLLCPLDVAGGPDGSVWIAEEELVRQVAPDGTLHTVAGNGEYPSDPPTGGPARKTPIEVGSIAAQTDGSLLIADWAACHVYRLADGRLTVVAGDGTSGPRHDDGAQAVDASLCPAAVAAAPDGGFYVADEGDASAAGSQPRVRRVLPDGRIVTVAGTGRYSPDPTRWDELRGDGMAGPTADLRHVTDVDALPDGGVVFVEGLGSFDEPPRWPDPGLIRYLPPAESPRLAVGVRRDHDRIFSPGAPAHVTLSLTAPADVTLEVRNKAGVHATVQQPLPAGETHLELPALDARPQTVHVAARDAAGRVAEDTAPLLPRGWLDDQVGRMLARGLVFAVHNASSISGEGVGPCRRFGPGRIDCSMQPGRRCDVVATIRLGADGRIRWGTYRCPISRHGKMLKRIRRLRRPDFSCAVNDPTCPPPLFGVVADRWLVPWG